MLFNRLVHLDKVERSVQEHKAARAVEKGSIKLCEEAKKLSSHIQLATDSAKLNAQVKFFVCPDWAGLPPTGYHLYCVRQGIPLPSLDISRFPYYLFGRHRVSDYVLDHPSISSVHAALIYHPERACFIVLDLQSTNGVRVNRSGEEGHAYERIDVATPIPLSEGAKIQFGYSSRVYELRRGKPPSSKRLREEQELAMQQASSKKVEIATTELLSSTDATSLSTCGERKNLPQDSTGSARAKEEEREKHSPDSQPNMTGGAQSSLSLSLISPPPPTNTASSSSRSAAAPPSAVSRFHLFQLVLKHKDVRHPINRGLRGRGVRITRSKEDAIEMAWWILRRHQEKKEQDAAQRDPKKQHHHNEADVEQSKDELQCATLPSRTTSLPFTSPTDVEWSVNEFIEAVREYSEMKSKNDDGDLDIVENGTYHHTFDEAAFQLQRNHVSAPVETPLGIHLIFRSD